MNETQREFLDELLAALYYMAFDLPQPEDSIRPGGEKFQSEIHALRLRLPEVFPLAIDD